MYATIINANKIIHNIHNTRLKCKKSILTILKLTQKVYFFTKSKCSKQYHN